jgi:hypothetical protein
VIEKAGAPGTIRTSDPQIRRLTEKFENTHLFEKTVGNFRDFVNGLAPHLQTKSGPLSLVDGRLNEDEIGVGSDSDDDRAAEVLAEIETVLTTGGSFSDVADLIDELDDAGLEYLRTYLDLDELENDDVDDAGLGDE